MQNTPTFGFTAVNFRECAIITLHWRRWRL